MTASALTVQVPSALRPVFDGPARIRGAYGGRGSTKSWSFARMLIAKQLVSPLRVLCARELQNSIRTSVHKVLVDQIEDLGLENHFEYGESYLRSKIGGEFLFKGLRLNAKEIKSTEGVDICWVEEAEAVSDDSFRVLLPTIRKPGSEIWLTWNPESADAAIQRRFIDNPYPDSRIVKINYNDNPWFSAELEAERLHDLAMDPDLYAHVWEGEFLTRSNAQVLSGKWEIADFTRPSDIDGPYYGLDWGFSSDPLAVVVVFIKNRTLYIEYEASGVGIEIDNTARFLDQVPEIRKHMVRADNARPELIRHFQNNGFRMEAAKKWPGSVEDGIAHLRSYDKIIIHRRCTGCQSEARKWSYKIDKLSGDVLPVLIDANNHFMDAVRYALGSLIKAPSSFFIGRA